MRTTRSGESALLLLDLIDVLTSHHVEYAVIGALAASVHGAVRASMDADVVMSAGMSQAKILGTALTAAGFETELVHGDFEDPIPALLKASDLFHNRVDLLFGLKGLDPQAFSRTIDVPFQGEALKFIGREDFVAMKAFAGGPLDLVDAARAITAAGASLDIDLVRRLASGFGKQASESLERLLKS